MKSVSFCVTDKLPVSSLTLNFSSTTEPFHHNISFCKRATIDPEVLRPSEKSVVRLTLKNVTHSSGYVDNSTESISHGEDLQNVFSQSIQSIDQSIIPTSGAAKVSETGDISPVVIPNMRLDLRCNVTESLLSTEKSRQLDKFDLSGNTSTNIVSDLADKILFPEQLQGTLGLQCSISDSHSIIKNVAQASRAVAVVSSGADDGSESVTARISCSDVNSLLATALAAGKPVAQLPAIPLFKYSVAPNYRPVVMKARHVLSIVRSGGTDSSGDDDGGDNDDDKPVRISLVVHVLVNNKAVTSHMVRDLQVQVSCSPLLALAPGAAVGNVAIVGSGSFNAGSKIITWLRGDTDTQVQSAVSVECSFDVTAPNARELLTDAAVAALQLPMIIKGTCDNLLSQATVACAPHTPPADDGLFGAPPPASSSDNNVTIGEISGPKLRTKLECRFL